MVSPSMYQPSIRTAAGHTWAETPWPGAGSSLRRQSIAGFLDEVATCCGHSRSESQSAPIDTLRLRGRAGVDTMATPPIRVEYICALQQHVGNGNLPLCAIAHRRGE